jgi:hypothetical protein
MIDGPASRPRTRRKGPSDSLRVYRFDRSRVACPWFFPNRPLVRMSTLAWSSSSDAAQPSPRCSAIAQPSAARPTMALDGRGRPHLLRHVATSPDRRSLTTTRATTPRRWRDLDSTGKATRHRCSPELSAGLDQCCCCCVRRFRPRRIDANNRPNNEQPDSHPPDTSNTEPHKTIDYHHLLGRSATTTLSIQLYTSRREKSRVRRVGWVDSLPCFG